MRVLIVAHGHPDETPTGGELAAHVLFQALRRRPGIEAHFAAPPQAPQLDEGRLTRWGGRAEEWRLPTGDFDRFLHTQRSDTTLEAFARLLAELRPDVVHFHHYFRIGADAIALARRVLPRGARILLTLHEFLALCHNNGQMVKTADNALCERAVAADCALCFPEHAPTDFALRRRFLLANFAGVDHFVAPSRFLRERYIAWGIAPERISAIENYVEPMPPVPPRPLPPGGRRAAFGYFGSIGVYKGVPQLVEAFETLVADPAWQDATLTLHGLIGFSTPAFEAWFREARERLAPRLRWHGRYARADLPGLMAGVDWVVVPSIWWENSPLVIQEARMFGRPLIVADIGGMAEKVTDGEDGFTFAAGDPDALAQTMAFAGPRHGAMRTHDIAAENAERLEALLRLYRGEAGAAAVAA
jgi:glycosyltransferase involved in cell wall biosynthesis